MTQLSYLWYIYWKDIWPWGFEGQSGLQMAMIYYSIFSNWHSKLRQQSHKNLLFLTIEPLQTNSFITFSVIRKRK